MRKYSCCPSAAGSEKTLARAVHAFATVSRRSERFRPRDVLSRYKRSFVLAAPENGAPETSPLGEASGDMALSSLLSHGAYQVLRRHIYESPKRNIFPKLEMDSRNYPLPPHANVDGTSVKNQTRRSGLNLKPLSFMQRTTLKFQGQGDTHE